MDARAERQRLLIAELRSAGGRLTARELAGRLSISTRSIRAYVRELNADSDEPLVVSDQDGYRLDRDEYRRRRARPSRDQQGYDSPEQRLYFIVRQLVAHADGVDVFELGDQVSVSPATIEADLGRARELLREHQLVIRRTRDLVRIEGTERQQRRLVRHLLLNSGQAALADSASTVGSPRLRSQLRQLHRRASEDLAATGLEVNEYALNDLLLHLAIAADRIRAGHQLPAGVRPEAGSRPGDDPVWTATLRLAGSVDEVFGIVLPPADLHTLHGILATRSSALADTASGISEEAMRITRDALRDVSNLFLIDLYDEGTVSALALHVQNLIARARAGQSLDTPLGPEFRHLHPLIHELALLFSREIETHARIEVHSGEVDFLAFHLGNQVQRQMTQGPPVTITCVAPRYSDLHEQLGRRLSEALQEQAVVQSTVTSLTYDWDELVSDLVVSVIELEAETDVPVVRISPFLTREDIDRVAEAVRAERARAARAKLRANLVSLLDPNLFHRVEEPMEKTDVLTLMSDTLEREGYTSQGFLAEVLDREQRSPTAFGGQFAIPHALHPNARKTGISALVSGVPIEWGGSQVRLVLMFAVSRDGRPVFRDVLDELIEVLNNPASITTLLDQAVDHHSFVRSLLGLVDG
ncbi:MAG: PTS sugar transporter subunit IIA [Actinobacteria bacterium]|nr:PTS sugar transporter subunit IIA [Actinomycetota bacterium]